MTAVFSGISHNDNTASTELTCDKAFSYVRRKNVREKERRMLTSRGVVDFTLCPRQHGVRMLLFKSFKIQRMQVFRPEIEPYFCCCYFKSFDRNLIFHEPIGIFLQLIVLKNFTGDARTSAETSSKARFLISP